MYPQQFPPRPQPAPQKKTSAWKPVLIGAAFGAVVVATYAVATFVDLRSILPDVPRLALPSSSPEPTFSSPEPPPFVKQADGGTFPSPQALVNTIESLGIECINPDYYTSKTRDLVVECSTGVSKVQFVVSRPGDNTLIDRALNDIGTQTVNNLTLLGRNWVLSTACDSDYGNRVRRAIGGEYTRTQFIKPTNCP